MEETVDDVPLDVLDVLVLEVLVLVDVEGDGVTHVCHATHTVPPFAQVSGLQTAVLAQLCPGKQTLPFTGSTHVLPAAHAAPPFAHVNT